MLLRRFQRDGWNFVLFTCLFTCLFSLFKSPVTAQQDVVLTMMSGEQCFGSRVTLLCTHPDPSNHPGMYVSDSFRWAEDGTAIDFTDPSSARFTHTRLTSTASTLSFTVTEEDHRDRVITCTCFLVLNNANRDRDESNVVTIDTLETTTPPTITSRPMDTSDVLRWTHTPNMCSDYTYRYALTWSRTDTPNNPTNGNDTVTTHVQEYDFSGLPRGNYTVTITAQRVDYPFVMSEPVSMSISLTAPTTTAATPTSPQGTCIERLSTGVIAGVVIGSVVVSLMIFIAGCGAGVIAILVYQKTSKQTIKSSESTEDKVTSSTPGYMNVELEDKSVPMTDNPSYEHVQRTQLTKPLYGNL